MRGIRLHVALAALGLALACGGSSATPPTQPTPPSPPALTVASILVGVAGNAPASLAPGDKLQFFAVAQNSDGTTADVTNTANWQSSDPVVAVVSSGGLLTAAAEGTVDVSATYQTVRGSLPTTVVKPGCRATVSPSSLTFGALASSASVTVTASLPDCRWTVRSDAGWLSFTYDPGRSGPGTFSYSVPGNNNTDPRDANLIVSVVGGPAAMHAVHQERPVGCVYKVSPESLTFSAPTGGEGSFAVTTIPGDCQWTMPDGYSDLLVTSGKSGIGAGTVTYKVLPPAYRGGHPLHVQGLSGLNPPAIHTAIVQ